MTQNSGLFRSPLMELEADWIDYNGHLNMAYYNVLFDRGCDGYFEMIGLGPDYVSERNMTFYTAEAHVRYVREIHLGDKVYVTMQVVDYDEKRVHAFASLYHESGWLSATSETMSLHIDMSGPKVAPFPDDVMSALKKRAEIDLSQGKPEGVGRKIEIVRKPA